MTLVSIWSSRKRFSSCIICISHLLTLLPQVAGSSEPSRQSLSWSQYQWPGIQRPDVQWNSLLLHVCKAAREGQEDKTYEQNTGLFPSVITNCLYLWTEQIVAKERRLRVGKWGFVCAFHGEGGVWKREKADNTAPVFQNVFF